MTRKITGVTYDNTLGQILNYQSLARFLLEVIEVHKGWSHFWDCPCGTGTLLACLNEMYPELTMFGLDNSEEQLQTASGKLGKERLIKEDIFNFPAVRKGSNLLNGFCHVGFCFFNTLNRDNRLILLREILSRETISTLGFEIQNSRHQEKCYEFGKWYTTNLSREVVLVTKSEKVSQKVKALVMKFQTAKQEYIIESEMSDWPIRDCIADCRRIGGKDVKVLVPSYRKQQTNITSHWFVVVHA